VYYTTGLKNTTNIRLALGLGWEVFLHYLFHFSFLLYDTKAFDFMTDLYTTRCCGFMRFLVLRDLHISFLFHLFIHYSFAGE
jgi:hypothetical protein